jgi:hypothetical protein
VGVAGGALPSMTSARTPNGKRTAGNQPLRATTVAAGSRNARRIRAPGRVGVPAHLRDGGHHAHHGACSAAGGAKALIIVTSCSWSARFRPIPPRPHGRGYDGARSRPGPVAAFVRRWTGVTPPHPPTPSRARLRLPHALTGAATPPPRPHGRGYYGAHCRLGPVGAFVRRWSGVTPPHPHHALTGAATTPTTPSRARLRLLWPVGFAVAEEVFAGGGRAA